MNEKPLRVYEPTTIPQFEAIVEHYLKLGWMSSPEPDGSVRLSRPPSYGTLKDHAVVFAFTFWTFGIGNATFASKEKKNPSWVKVKPPSDLARLLSP